MERLEHRRQSIASGTVFIRRMSAFLAVALAVILVVLGIGMLGYHGFEGLTWLDAFLNAAMILGGMGPVAAIHTPGGKLFAGVYALLCGLVFIGLSGLLFAPIFHRVLHRFHVPDDKG
jgi:hypothetical protein